LDLRHAHHRALLPYGRMICAIQTAIRRGDQTLRNLRWFEVVQTRGQVENGEVRHYQVVLKAGLTLEGESP
jgi:dodecin